MRAYTLHLRRAGTEIAGVDETWAVTVPDRLAAISHLSLHKDEQRTVTATLYRHDTEEGAPEWYGTGRAGQGTVNHNFAH